MPNDLHVELFPGWRLTNPFWVASADLSHSEASLSHLVGLPIAPGAITLKTTAPIKREEFSGTKRFATNVRIQRDPFERNLRGQTNPTIYCDGPPIEEYLSIPETKKLLAFAKGRLPKTKIGTSVLMGEDYEGIADALRGLTDFAELNLKYAARVQSGGPNESFFAIQDGLYQQTIIDIERFAAAFAEVPVFVKVTREFGWLGAECSETDNLVELLQRLAHSQNVGLVVANTRKQRVPNDLITSLQERARRDDLNSGIVAGEYLYIETYNLVRSLADRYLAFHSSVPLIATGGVTTLSAVLEMMRAGARAVQLYTALHTYTPDYLTSLCSDLSALMEGTRFSTFERFRTDIRREPNRKARDLALLIPRQNRDELGKTLDAQSDMAMQELTDGFRRRVHQSTRQSKRTGPQHRNVPERLQTANALDLPVFEPSGKSPDRRASADGAIVDARVLCAPSNFDVNVALTFFRSETIRLHIDDTSRVEDVLTRLKGGEPWDLAFLSAPYLEQLTLPPDSRRVPVVLGRFLDEEYVLATLGDPGSVTDVYNFGGPEATYALDEIGSRVGHEFTRRTVKTDAVLLWLHSERRGVGLVARDPVFTAYRMFSHRKLKGCHRVAMPVYLIGSTEFCEGAAAGGLQRIYNALIGSLESASDLDNAQQLESRIGSEAWKSWERYLGVSEKGTRRTSR